MRLTLANLHLRNKHILLTRRIAILCLSLLGTFAARLHAQNANGYFGREFWVTFMQNSYDPTDTGCHLLIVPTRIDTVFITNIYTGASKSCPVWPNKVNRIHVLKSVWYSVVTGGGQNTGVRVTSKYGAMAVYAVNPIASSLDVTAVLPIEYLSNSQLYFINTIGGDETSESQACALAIDPGITTIEVTTTANLTGSLGFNFTVDLQQGQVFLMQAYMKESLAGTSIKVINSCKRIAVFMGGKCAKSGGLPSCAGCDILYEQAWPTAYMGKKYLVPPVPGNTAYTLSIVALKNNTQIMLDGVSQGTFNAGQAFVKNIPTVIPVLVETNNAVSVCQVMNSNGCNGNPSGGKGDPSLLNIAPLGSGVNMAGLTVYKATSYDNYLVVMVQSMTAPIVKVKSSSGTIKQLIVFTQRTVNGQTYWHGVSQVSPVSDIDINYNYTITCDSMFAAYSYGLKNAESYATCFGSGFKNFEADFQFNPKYVCDPATPFHFEATGDSLFSFKWLFGNGDSSMLNPVDYNYAQPGKYKAKLLNYRGNQWCKADTISKDLVVFDKPKSVLQKDTAPCLGTFVKVTLPAQPGVKYTWSDGSPSTIRNFNSNVSLTLVIADSNGCKTVDTLRVVYRDCSFLDLKLANVFTPNGDGYNDEWAVLFNGYEQINIRIFNRWGQEIYTYSLPEDMHWNGKVDNAFAEVPEGSYFYQVDAVDKESASTKSVNGVITLIR